MIHPEFPRRVTAQVVDAVYQRISAVGRYQAFFTGGIVKAEIEDLFFLHLAAGSASGLEPPALAVVVGPIDVDPLASQRSVQTTVVDLVIAWPPPDPCAAAEDLRSRVLDDLRATLQEGYGQLTDENGAPVSEALTRFQRLNPALAVPRGNPAMLVDRVRVGFRSWVDSGFRFEG